MKQCMECGAKLGERDEFCVGCGARVYQGEDCESYVFEEDVEEVAAAAVEVEAEFGPKLKTNSLSSVRIDTFRLMAYLKDMLLFVREVYMKPVASAVRYGREPLREPSFMMALVMGIIIGLVSMWMLKRVSSSSLFQILNLLGAGFSIPLWKAFLIGFGSFLLMLVSLMLGIFASGQLIYNVRARLLSLWNIAIAAGLLYTTSALLIVALSYLFPILIPVFLVFMGVTVLVSIYQAVKDLMNLPEDHAAFTVGFGFVVMMAIMYLVNMII